MNNSGWMARGETFYANLLAGKYPDTPSGYLQFNKDMAEREARGEVASHKFGTSQGAPVYYRLRKRRSRK